MKTVVLDVRSSNEAMTDLIRVWKSGKGEKAARISLATPELLWKVPRAKRWQLLKIMCGAGPILIREVAGRVGRDVNAVHTDVTAPLNIGVLDSSQDGWVIFPFGSVKGRVLA